MRSEPSLHEGWAYREGMQEVLLVLGGGGARGFAHVGALRALEEAGLRVRAIAGCSFGAIVGALHAAGADSERLEAIANEVRYESIVSLGTPGGVIGGEGIERELARFLPERFEDLAFPLAMTTVDVQRGELVILREGPLVPALRATSALPGLIAPMQLEGRWLVDGGMLNNLPVDVARTLGGEPVIAIDVAVPANRTVDIPDAGNAWVRMWNALRPQRATALALFMKSFDVPQALITQMRLTMSPPDVLVRPDLGSDFGVEQVGRRDEAIAIGYEATRAALATWRERAGDDASEGEP